MSTLDSTQIPVNPAQAAADAAAQQAIATQQAADQAAAQAAQAQADAQAELERQQVQSVNVAGNSGPQLSAGTTVTVLTPVARDVATIIPEVLAAINDPGGFKKSGLAILTAIVGVLVSVGLIPSATDTAIISAASILLPAVFMVATAIHGHATATVQAAAITAKGGK